MWRIEEHRRVDKQAASAPLEILKRYEKWKDIASISGPPGLRLIKGFHDEALSGEWEGFRSSRLGDQWRVICRVVALSLPLKTGASASASSVPRSWRKPSSAIQVCWCFPVGRCPMKKRHNTAFERAASGRGMGNVVGRSTRSLDARQ